MRCRGPELGSQLADQPIPRPNRSPLSRTTRRRLVLRIRFPGSPRPLGFYPRGVLRAEVVGEFLLPQSRVAQGLPDIFSRFFSRPQSGDCYPPSRSVFHRFIHSAVHNLINDPVRLASHASRTLRRRWADHCPAVPNPRGSSSRNPWGIVARTPGIDGQITALSPNSIGHYW